MYDDDEITDLPEATLDETFDFINQMQAMKAEILAKLSQLKETSKKDKEQIEKIINYFI